MILHKDKLNFDILIKATSNYFKISNSIVEKDYYVTLFLKELVTKVPEIVFKGGTSLSKCYKIINRFSEDIDITLDSESITQSYKKRLKKSIIEICSELKINLLNENQTRSKRDYNCYKIDYHSKYTLHGINPQLVVETVFFVKTFPYEIKEASSLIYDYLKLSNKTDVIEKYNLLPYLINVQTLDRTFIDKVFAICDYMLDNKIERQSRHIYDLYQLSKFVLLNEDLKHLIFEVRNERKLSERCFSAKNDIDVNKLLKKIIDTNFYKNDYEKVTSILLSKKVTYDECINVLEKIIESKVFNN